MPSFFSLQAFVTACCSCTRCVHDRADPLDFVFELLDANGRFAQQASGCRPAPVRMLALGSGLISATPPSIILLMARQTR